MFEANNLKYRYLVEAIELSRNKIEKNIQYGISFGEFNHIPIGGIRQSGKTLAMKKLFNPKKDIIITPRVTFLKEFFDDSIDIDDGSVLHEWSENDRITVELRNASMAMNQKYLEEKLLITLKEDSIIFLDVWSTELTDNYKHVKTVMDILKKFQTENMLDVRRVLVVYT